MSVFSRGSSLVMTRLSSYFSKAGAFAEQLGLSYYYFLSDLVRDFDANSDEIVRRLAEVAKIIFTKSNLFIETIGESGEVSAVKDHLYEIADDLPDGNVYQKHTFDFAEGNKNEAFLTSGKVQYVGEGGDFRKYGFNYTGALRVMETILRYEYLWKKVRVQGGAYGAFTQFLSDGTAILCSYRDPNLKQTLETYKNLPEYIRTLELSDREMTKYVIGTMAADEIQLTPSMKGERAMLHYLNGNSVENRRKVNDEIVNCTVEDIRKLAPLLQSVIDHSSICVMGNEEKIHQDADVFDKILSLPD